MEELSKHITLGTLTSEVQRGIGNRKRIETLHCKDHMACRLKQSKIRKDKVLTKRKNVNKFCMVQGTKFEPSSLEARFTFKKF